MLARESFEAGEAAFGAVIVSKEGKVLAASRNQTISEDNPILHAEIVSIRDACKSYGSKALVGSTIYCSCEPCMMCLSAAFYSQIEKVVFAATLDDAIKDGSGDPPLRAYWLNETGNLGLELIQGIYRDDALKVFRDYIKKYGRLDENPSLK